MTGKNDHEIIHGYTADSTVDHLAKKIHEAKQRNRSFALRKMGRLAMLDFSPISKIDGAIAHRDVIGKASSVVRKLQKNRDILSLSKSGKSELRNRIADQCSQLADTMECIEMGSSWESSAFKSLSEFLTKH